MAYPAYIQNSSSAMHEDQDLYGRKEVKIWILIARLMNFNGQITPEDRQLLATPSIRHKVEAWLPTMVRSVEDASIHEVNVSDTLRLCENLNAALEETKGDYDKVMSRYTVPKDDFSSF